MSFNPELCRNESEVESKLIVQYLLPRLGYTPDTWHQEVTFGRIRLDFLAFATQTIPFVLDANSPLSVVMEAKHPNQNLNNHLGRLKRYLTSLNVRYGLLTNGREIRIYERVSADIQLIFQCSGKEVEARIEEMRGIIGRDNVEGENKLIGFVEASNTPHATINSPSLKNPPTITPFSPATINSPTLEDPTILPPIEEITTPIEVQRQSNVKVIAVYHNKGGVGKTTTVVNLAAAIRKRGKRVLVIDLDSQANTTFATGLVKFDDEEFDDIKDSNIRHVLQSEEFYPLSEVARNSQFSSPEITVVPSHISLMEYEISLNQQDSSKMMLLQKLEAVVEDYDIVLIDTPPSLNLYARIALITADYLLIPSDLKPFANQGLINIRNFVRTIDGFRRQIRKPPIEIIGIVACKISTSAKFVQYTLPKRIQAVMSRYDFYVLDTVIYERDDLAKCAEGIQKVGDIEIPDPVSVLDFKPDSTAAREFELLAMEVLQKIGMAE